MNAKTAKLLRRSALESSLPGEPLRQLVQFAQICNPWYNPVTKKTEPRQTVCAVNNPLSFRGRYRNLKSGRTIDMSRIVKEQTFTRGKQAMTHNPAAELVLNSHQKKTLNIFQRAAQKARRFFRKQS